MQYSGYFRKMFLFSSVSVYKETVLKEINQKHKASLTDFFRLRDKRKLFSLCYLQLDCFMCFSFPELPLALQFSTESFMSVTSSTAASTSF